MVFKRIREGNTMRKILWAEFLYKNIDLGGF